MHIEGLSGIAGWKGAAVGNILSTVDRDDGILLERVAVHAALPMVRIRSHDRNDRIEQRGGHGALSGTRNKERHRQVFVSRAWARDGFGIPGYRCSCRMQVPG